MTVGSDRLNWPEENKVNESLKGTDGARCDEVVLWCSTGTLLRGSEVWQSKMQMLFLTYYIIIRCVLHKHWKHFFCCCCEAIAFSTTTNIKDQNGLAVIIVLSVKRRSFNNAIIYKASILDSCHLDSSGTLVWHCVCVVERQFFCACSPWTPTGCIFEGGRSVV